MKIGYDAKRAFHNKTGLGNYSRFLIDIMIKYYPENKYYLFNPKPSSLYDPSRINSKEILPSRAWRQLRGIWRTFFLATAAVHEGLDIFHGLSHELPFSIRKSRTKWILTVHDLIFIRFPHYFKFTDRLIYRQKLLYSCKKANRIIAVSKQTKNDLISFLGISENKIDVVYQGCDANFKQELTDDRKQTISKTYNLPERFLLQVGTLESRKNLLLSVRALAMIPGDVKLVSVGKPTSYLEVVKKEIERLELGNRIIFLHTLPFEDLPVLYKMATVFLYPSRFEGFGIPILEALNCGVPVIAATGSCLEEAGGPGSYYVHPDDEVQTANYINILLNNPYKRIDMIKTGKTHADNFSDEKIADRLMDIYLKTLRDN